jgi:hypothetical protein
MPALENGRRQRESLKEFGLTVTRTFTPKQEVYFYDKVVNSVVVYSGRVIPSLEKSEEKLRPGTGLILKRVEYDELSKRNLVTEPMLSMFGQVENKKRMELILTRVADGVVKEVPE